MENIEENKDSLSNETRLVLSIENDDTDKYSNGTFLSMKLDFNLIATSYHKEGTTRFVNLDTIWYGIVENENYDSIEYVFELNPSQKGLYGEG